MSEVQAAPAVAGGSEPKSQTSRKLPTDRIAFGKMLDILRAYGVSSAGGTRAVHYSTVANFINMSANTVSLMNTFMVDNGLVEKSGNDFIPNRALIDFAQAYSWQPETAAKKLAPAFKKTWFGTHMLARLQFRSMSTEDAIHDLAGLIGATPDMRAQVETLINLLVVSGLVRQEGGSLYLGNDIDAGAEAQPPRADKQPEPEPVQDRQGDTPRSAATSRSVATSFSSAAGRVQLHVNIDVSMEEMGGWTPDRITAFFAGLAQVLAAKKGAEDIK